MKKMDKAKLKDDIERFLVIMPLVMRFIPLNQVAHSSHVCIAWNRGVGMYR